MLARLGRLDKGIIEIKRAYELDPFSRAIKMSIGLRYENARRFDEALAQFNKVLETEPDYPIAYEFISYMYEEKGLYDGAIDLQLKGTLIFEPENTKN